MKIVHKLILLIVGFCWQCIDQCIGFSRLSDANKEMRYV